MDMVTSNVDGTSGLGGSGGGLTSGVGGTVCSDGGLAGCSGGFCAISGVGSTGRFGDMNWIND